MLPLVPLAGTVCLSLLKVVVFKEGREARVNMQEAQASMAVGVSFSLV